MRARGRRWPWVVLGCIAVVGGLLLIAQDQETLRVRSPLAASDPRFAEYIASLLGAPISEGDAYEVLENGDQIFPAMLGASARPAGGSASRASSTPTASSPQAFTEALASAGRRGVSVRLVFDSFGSLNLSKSTIDQLRSAGVEIVWFNPLASWSIEEVNYRTHRKVLVVDGTVAFTGGVGVADHWRGNARYRG